MTNASSRLAALRERHPIKGRSPIDDLLFDHDVRLADEWLATVGAKQARRRGLQDRLEAMAAANERDILEPLRQAAADALASHIAASAALEAARIACECGGAELRREIDALTKSMTLPRWPQPTEWKPIEGQTDAREAALAASTLMKTGVEAAQAAGVGNFRS